MDCDAKFFIYYYEFMDVLLRRMIDKAKEYVELYLLGAKENLTL